MPLLRLGSGSDDDRMAMTVEAREVATSSWLSLSLASAAAAPAERVLAGLDSRPEGLASAEAQRRLGIVGPNALRTHGARPLAVLARQLRNPLLVLLLGAALTSFFVGERLDALIILLISGLSIGLGFFNEYRSERAVDRSRSATWCPPTCGCSGRRDWSATRRC